MTSDNPTLAAANESTGLEPLNAQPTSPQPPKQHPTGDEIPSSLTSLPTGFEPFVFPLDLGSRTKSSQTVSALPSANAFKDLVKAKIRPPGPARAEEVDVKAWEAEMGSEYADIVDKVRNAVEGGQVKVYKVGTGLGKGEYYVAGLDLDGERILGVRVTSLDG